MGRMAPSHKLDVADFDDVTTINYRGLWIAQRAEISHMLKQEPLATHDGRPGNRGAVVNIASNLGLVSRPETRMSIQLHPSLPLCIVFKVC